MAIAPVLIHRTNKEQRVTFAGKDNAAATAERFREIKLDKAAVEKSEHVVRHIAERGGHPGAVASVPKRGVTKRRK